MRRLITPWSRKKSEEDLEELNPASADETFAAESSSSDVTRENVIESDELRPQVTQQTAGADDTKTTSTAKSSFQYGYNSNPNSLFSKYNSSASTNISSNPSSSTGDRKRYLGTGTSISSLGRPLRVLIEEEMEDQDERIEGEEEMAHSAKSSRLKNRTSSMVSSAINSNFIIEEEVSVTSLPFSNNSSLYDQSLAEQQSLQQLSSNRIATTSTNAPGSLTTDELIEMIEKQLRILASNLLSVVLQINQSIINCTRASLMIIEYIDSTIAQIGRNERLKFFPPRQICTIESLGLRKFVKSILLLVDVILRDEVYRHSRSLILSKSQELLVKLKLTNSKQLIPCLFSIGCTSQPLPNQDKINMIMEQLANEGSGISDQEGAFVAPVLRGFGEPSLSILTFIYGFPQVSKEHIKIVNLFHGMSEDMHFMCQQNAIKPAATKFKAPFRISNSLLPPVSMSISTCESSGLSGTLGGYLYPKIPKDTKNEKLLSDLNSTFAITCAHVLLDTSGKANSTIKFASDTSRVSVPSAVLINMYRKALFQERNRYQEYSEEFQAYNRVVEDINVLFPPQQLVFLQKLPLDSDNKYRKLKIKRNLPPKDFGKVLWAERVIDEESGGISDLAIVKLDTKDKSLRVSNHLGDDVSYNEYDPSLIMSNLYVKKVINLDTLDKRAGGAGTTGAGGLKVFKYGSTTKYTSGNLNGVRLVYWSEGKLQSSNFVVRSSNYSQKFGGSGNAESTDNNGVGFASAGDSGAWILSKLQDVKEYQSFTEKLSEATMSIFDFHGLKQETSTTGLGVVGMIHSYDGEFKQFGLFTPMTAILQRLQRVTNVEWCVAGCEDGDVDTEGEHELSDLEQLHMHSDTD
ncbi:BA75_02447T0 [Komagataella pastoris]|uniref:BA75_02447T0 n=1 Tax=Komagataella pastoris TaxID=4922 RepID=A0A1B2JDV7_PICPA|nr:BA75_02447T0 [Komagataella pastoris]